MALTPRLAWRKWRLRKQAVEPDGKPLTAGEVYLLGKAEFALLDDCGSRRAAVEEDVAVMLAEALLGPSAGEADETAAGSAGWRGAVAEAAGGVTLPFDYPDPDGDVLTIGRNGDGRVFIQTTAPGVTVAAGDLPEVFRAMCAAAGTSLAAVLAAGETGAHGA